MTSHASNTRGAAAASAKLTDFQWGRRHTIVAVCTAVAAIGIAIGATLWWKASHGVPPFNADIVSFTRFVISPGLKELPFARQQAYIEKMHDRRKEVVEAYQQKKLNAEEAQAAADFIWAGKHLFHMRTYFELPEGQLRDDYITSLARSRERKDQEKRKKEKTASTTQPAIPDGPSIEDDPTDLPKPDNQAQSELPKAWPADVAQRWQIFHETLRRLEGEVEQEFKAEKKAKKKAKKRAAKEAAAIVSPD